MSFFLFQSIGNVAAVKLLSSIVEDPEHKLFSDLKQVHLYRLYAPLWDDVRLTGELARKTWKGLAEELDMQVDIFETAHTQEGVYSGGKRFCDIINRRGWTVGKLRESLLEIHEDKEMSEMMNITDIIEVLEESINNKMDKLRRKQREDGPEHVD